MTKLERNRLIYKCYQKGMTQEEIGELFDLSQSSISYIVIKMEEGVNYNTVETRGVKSRLSAEEKDRLSFMLKDSPQNCDYVVWNKWSIKSLIKDEFGVNYHENYIWAIMKELRFTSQKPAIKDYRQDEEEVSHFKEVKAQNIKKK